MSDIPPITYTQRIADNSFLKAAHMLLTMLLPVMTGALGWYADRLDSRLETVSKELAEANSRLAVVATYEPRINRLEAWQQATNDDVRRRGRFDPSDGRELEAKIMLRVDRLEDRLTDAERRIPSR
ncbi:hypothetical protein [Hwanghaeella sp.]|uniref:hypothetical protein n=1 Tax=Hwanghaeella sp. TaxID=2605943 RepID=UPI003CCBF8D1